MYKKILYSVNEIHQKYFIDDDLSKQFILAVLILKNSPFSKQKRLSFKDLLDDLNILNNRFKVNFLYNKSFNDLYLDDSKFQTFFEDIPSINCNHEDAYEFLFDNFYRKDRKNKEGIFYTPKKVAQLTINSALEEFEYPLSNKTKICDPACGGGIFLRTLLSEYSKSNLDIIDFANLCLYGYDKDPLAVELTKLLLAHTILTLDQNSDLNKLDLKNIKVRDSLLSNNKLEEFDLILANPPFGLSRDKQISVEENKLLREKYSDIISGKANKYILFMYLCHNMLKPSGVLAIITPNSWLGISNAKKIREFFFEKKCLKKIMFFKEKLFNELGVETLITIVRNKTCESFEIKYFEKITEQSTSTNTITLGIQNKFPELLIPIYWKDKYRALFLDVSEKCFKISNEKSLFTPLIALQAYSLGKGTPPQTKSVVKTHNFHSLKKNDSNHYPYINGKDLSSYEINWSKQYLNYGPWLSEFQPIERYTGPRILIREILNKKPYILHSCYTDEPFLYNRSILHIITKDKNHIKQAKALNNILNSKFASFFLLLMGRKADRSLFPKILKSDLADFLLPPHFNDKYDCLDLSPELPLTESYRKDIDRIVYNFYDLNPKFIDIIEDEL